MKLLLALAALVAVLGFLFRRKPGAAPKAAPGSDVADYGYPGQLSEDLNVSSPAGSWYANTSGDPVFIEEPLAPARPNS